MEREDFKRRYPKLSKEIETGKSKVEPDKLREPNEAITKPPKASYKTKRKYAGYQPNYIDFLRRCVTIKQAEEIILYLQNKGELILEEADALRKQLHEKGIRSFGEKKEPGYYER